MSAPPFQCFRVLSEVALHAGHTPASCPACRPLTGYLTCLSRVHTFLKIWQFMYPASSVELRLLGHLLPQAAETIQTHFWISPEGRGCTQGQAPTVGLFIGSNPAPLLQITSKTIHWLHLSFFLLFTSLKSEHAAVTQDARVKTKPLRCMISEVRCALYRTTSPKPFYQGSRKILKASALPPPPSKPQPGLSQQVPQPLPDSEQRQRKARKQD